MRAREPVPAVGFCADSEQGDEPPEREFACHEADEDGNEEVGVEGHHCEHEEVRDEGLQSEEDGAGQVDGEREGRREGHRRDGAGWRESRGR